MFAVPGHWKQGSRISIYGSAIGELYCGQYLLGGASPAAGHVTSGVSWLAAWLG
jgi:hypothetical protein